MNCSTGRKMVAGNFRVEEGRSAREPTAGDSSDGRDIAEMTSTGPR